MRYPLKRKLKYIDCCTSHSTVEFWLKRNRVSWKEAWPFNTSFLDAGRSALQQPIMYPTLDGPHICATRSLRLLCSEVQRCGIEGLPSLFSRGGELHPLRTCRGKLREVSSARRQPTSGTLLSHRTTSNRPFLSHRAVCKKAVRRL